MNQLYMQQLYGKNIRIILLKVLIDKNNIGFVFDTIEKNELFKTVILEGSLPRKTFSMGISNDKRFYLESRKIK